MTYVCTSCGEAYISDGMVTVCACGKPLAVHMEWEPPPDTSIVDLGNPSLWRYQSILPPINDEHITSLIEGWTPLLDAVNYKNISLFFKDETTNPTGSFKDRGMAMAVSQLKSYDVRKVCLPSAGNAGISAAAYCEKAGMECHVYLPEDIPASFVDATESFGAKVRLAGKTIAEAAATLRDERKREWFDLSTLKEPFRVEGKKTLGYEIAEQLGWQFPDVVVYPTGGGTGLIGMWKAFNEMKEFGWVENPLPRMVAVQSSGCAPIVKAFVDVKDRLDPWKKSKTIAFGLNVPSPLGGSWMLKVLRASHGIAVMVEEERILSAQEEVASVSGKDPSPEVAVAWLGFQTLVDSGWIRSGERVIIPITGSGERYK